MSANSKTERKLVENYLSQHDLEATINEVVNFCVRDRPRDPYEFMAKSILEKSTTVKGITGVSAYQVLDCNGAPCLEVAIQTERGEFTAQVPSDKELLDPWRRPNTSAFKPQDEAKAADPDASAEPPATDGSAPSDAAAGDPANDNAGGDDDVDGDAMSAATDVKKPAMPPYSQLRDGDEHVFGGLGVLRAVGVVNGTIGPLLLGKDPVDQASIDDILTSTDGTESCSVLGSNVMLAVSLAICRAGASEKRLPLCRHLASLAGNKQQVIPVPCFALLSGGKLAPNEATTMPFEQIGIMPTGADNFAHALEIGHNVGKSLVHVVHARAYAEAIPENKIQIMPCADGTWCVSNITDIEGVLELVMEALEHSGNRETVRLAIRVNADVFYNNAEQYYDLGRFSLPRTGLPNNVTGLGIIRVTPEEFLELFRKLLEQFPEIVSLEDPFSSPDGNISSMLNEEFSDVVQIAGDRVLRCRPELIQEAVSLQSLNAVVVKLTNVRTVSDLVNTCKEAQQDRLGVVLSTSDIETGDSALADLAVALQVGMMKVGPMQRAENMSKYNTLARLEAQLGKEAFYAAERFREPV